MTGHRRLRSGVWAAAILAACVAAALSVGLQGGTAPAPATAASAPFQPPPVRHVWVIALENSSWIDGAAHDSPLNTPGRSPYLREVLRKRGNTLTQYWGVAHNSEPNYDALLGGQGANPETQDDCAQASEWSPPQSTADNHGQWIGQGCYFPPNVKTLYNQLDDNHLTWRDYQEDLGNRPGLDYSDRPCPFKPVDGSGDVDRYATKHDPAQWFHAVMDNQTACKANDVSMYRLADDLQTVKTTPNFNFVTPNLDNDAHQTDQGGQYYKTADPWLRQYVPMIMNSPAYRQDGMIVIWWDESDTLTGVPTNNDDTDANLSCCGEIPGPNSPSPGIAGSGGGRTGALVLSPFAKPGSSTDTPYNHYSTLRSLEDLFKIDTGGDDGKGHLGFAGGYGVDYPGPAPFGADVYNAPRPPASQPASAPGGGPTGPRRSDGSTNWQYPRPQGNDLNGVDCPTTQVCYAVGATGSIVKTSNGGDSWSRLDSGRLAQLSGIACPTADECVAVGDSGLVLTTSDGGAGWSARDSGSNADLTDVACPSASICYAIGTDGTILRSPDSGASWSPQKSGVQERLNGISCPSTSVCYAVGNPDLTTGTGGTTSRSGRIVATTDGSTWVAEKSSTSDRINDVSCSAPTTCIAATDGSFLRTTNGTSWSPNFSGAIATQSIPFGVSCPTAANCYTVGLNHPSTNGFTADQVGLGFIATTTDGGTTYNRKSAGLASTLKDVSCPAADTCVAVGSRGTLLRTSDSGATWGTQSLGSESDLARMICTDEIQCLAEGVNAVQATACPDVSNCFAVGSYGTIMATGDGGANWAEQVSGAPKTSGSGTPPPTAPGLNGISCPNGNRCVAVGDVGSDGHPSIKSTTDGGTTWHDQASPGGSDLLAVSCPSTSVCLASGANGSILRTTDGGATWGERDSGVGNDLASISCADESTCVAVGSFGAMLRTTDGGEHWSAGNSGTTAFLAGVSCPSRELCVAVGSGGTALRITGAGEQASERPSGVGDDLMGVSCSSQTHCVASGSMGTVISTATGGDDWDAQGTGTSRALRATSCPATDRCIAAGDVATILGVTPTAKPGQGPGPSGDQGLRDPLGSACVASAPRTSFLRRGLKVTRRSVRISGRAVVSDCASHRLSRAQVALARVVRGRCQFLGRNGRLGRRRSCRRPVYQLARVRGSTWSFSKRVRLPRGSYRVLVRVRDSAGRLQARALARTISLRRR